LHPIGERQVRAGREAVTARTFIETPGKIVRGTNVEAMARFTLQDVKDCHNEIGSDANTPE